MFRFAVEFTGCVWTEEFITILTHLSSQAMEAVANTSMKSRYKIAISRLNKNTA